MNDTANAAVKMETNATTPDQWVEAHGDYVFNFAIGQLRDASVAEDLVQDAQSFRQVLHQGAEKLLSGDS